MKLSDPRLKVIARDMQLKMSPIIATAALVIDGRSLTEAAEILETQSTCIAPIYLAVFRLMEADAAKRKPRKPRATDKIKMPADWKLCAGDMDYGKRLGFDATQLLDEAAYFKTYWIANGSARPGWSLTWQGWIRRKAERGQNDQARNALPPPEITNVEISPEQWKSAIETFNDLGAWPRSYGPAPNERGCRAPKEFLAMVTA